MVLTSTYKLCFEQNYEKCQSFFIRKFSDFGGEIFYLYLNRRVFIMKLWLIALPELMCWHFLRIISVSPNNIYLHDWDVWKWRARSQKSQISIIIPCLHTKLLIIWKPGIYRNSFTFVCKCHTLFYMYHEKRTITYCIFTLNIGTP